MKKTIRLRSLLVLLALVAVAPGLAALGYSFVAVQRDEIVKAGDELESVSRLVAANQEQLIEGVRQILATVASGPSVRRNDLHDLCVEFLRNVEAATQSYSNIGLLDLKGNIECQSRPNRAGANASGLRYFRDAIETGAFSVGEYIVGLSSGRKAVAFGMPVYDYAGALHGVAFASLDLEYANRQLNSIVLPKNLRIQVSDTNGLVIVSNIADASIGTPVADPALRAAVLARRSSRFEATDASHVQWLHAVRPIAGTSRDTLMVSVSVRKSEAVALANTHFKVQLAIMGAAALLGFVLAWLFAHRSLAQPVARLLERMRRIELGQASPLQSDVAGSAEFAELDSGFSSMLAMQLTNQQQLLKAQEITRVGFWQLDLKTRLYTGSKIVYEILGIDPTSGPMTIDRFRTMVHPDDMPTVIAHRNAVFTGNAPTRLQYRIIRPDQSVRWIDLFGVLEYDAQGTPVVYSGAVQDITQRRFAEQAARSSENRFRLLFENSLDGVLQTLPDGSVLAANAAACKIFGMSEEQLKQRGRTGVVAADDERVQALMAERAATGATRGELTMVRADGSHFEVELSSTLYADDDGEQVCSIVLRDITERIRAEQHIHRLAFFDVLTELPNRRLLVERLTAMLATAQRSQQIGAVLFVDLDHFKNVNDARGHAMGDMLLRQVAQRLLLLMRAEDTVARIGGDEFVILLSGVGTDFTLGAQHAMTAAEKVREALAAPFVVEGQPYASGGSIGVTLLPKPGQTTEDLLREADTAMYRAKTAGRNRIAFFEATMQAEVEERLALEHDLAQAIGTTQLEMVMQPQFDHQRRAVGCELLMRWTHPARGPMSPATFIPVAEECGLILRLGDWVIREGCHTLLQLQQAGCAMSVAVNVSPRQFRQPDFVSRVKAILAETGAPASQLIFEITEGLLIDNLEDTILRMQDLVAFGIRFSIDDFGTGYSSLNYVRRLPLYELKIDRRFMHDTPADTGRAAIVQSILSMASHLGLRVVAEGVETEAQQRFLESAGCDFMQGYLLARPMSVAVWLECQSALI